MLAGITDAGARAWALFSDWLTSKGIINNCAATEVDVDSAICCTFDYGLNGTRCFLAVVPSSPVLPVLFWCLLVLYKHGALALAEFV